MGLCHCADMIGQLADNRAIIILRITCYQRERERERERKISGRMRE
jgi:hypothetical protein